MNRDKWIFPLTAKQILVAAKAKKTHHLARLKFWQGAQAKTLAAAKKNGLSIEESLAGASYSSTARGPQINVAEKYQRELQESHGKIQEHQKQVATFDGWIEVLTANPSRSYDLHADDYLFFYGK